MTSIWKRSLSLFLAMVMIVGMLPMNALAVEEEPMADDTSSGVVEEEFYEEESEEEEAYSEEELTPDDEGGEDEPSKELEDPAVKEAIEVVEALIAALPTEIVSDAQAEATEATLEHIDSIVENQAFPADAYQALDWQKIVDTYDALDAWYQIPEGERTPALLIGESADDAATYEQKDAATNKADDFISFLSSRITIDNATDTYQYRQVGATSWSEIKKTSLGNWQDDGVSLTQGNTYEVQRKWSKTTWNGWTPTTTTGWSSTYYVTFKIYHEVTASVDSTANAEGAGKVTATGKVYHNEEATVTVTDVDGYKAELYNGDTKVAELSDTAGWTYTINNATASVAYTVKYVSETETEYPVAITVVNGSWGSATLGTDKGIAGAEIALTISPKAVTGNAMYTYEVDVVNGSYDATTGKVTVAGTGDVTVTVTFSEDKLELKENPQIEINGAEKDTILDGLKDKILTASIQGYAGNADDYKVSIWLDFGFELNLVIVKFPNWVDLDNSGILSALSGAVDEYLGGEFWIKVGDVLDVQIVDQHGRTVEPDVVALDSRWTTSIVWNPDGGTWNDGTTDNKTSDNVRLNTTVSAPGTVTKEHYTFDKWSPDPSKKIEQTEITYTAQWKPVNYTVKWDTNGDGTVDETADYPYGTAANKITVPATAKTEDAQYTYTPNGWDKAIADVTGPVTYTAQFTPVLRSYTVTFKNEGENGAVLDTQTVNYGVVPVYAGETTVDALAAAKNDAQYTWSFAGWVADANVAEDGTITGNVTYTATYTNTTNSYTVIYKDGETELNRQTLEYGSAPVYGGETTVDKLAEGKYTAQYSYTFKEWVADANVDENGKITGNVVFTATYTETTNQYTVTLKDMDGNEIGMPETVDYGTKFETAPVAPTAPEGQVFAGWHDGTNYVTFPLIVVGDITLTAQYVDAVARIEGKIYVTLQEAINAAADGDTIVLLKNVGEDVTVVQKPDVKITIDGNNKTYTGSITVDGKSQAYATAGLTIQNVNFTLTGAKTAINLGVDGNSNTRYTSNVTVNNCTFTGTGNAAAAIKNYTGGCENLTVTNCAATGVHSLVQVKGVAGVKIANVKVEGKNGIAVGTSTKVTIENATITATGYGIRADGTGAYNMTVEGGEITANQPIVVRKTTGAYELTVENVELTATSESGCQIVLTKDDDGTEVKPTGKFKLKVSDNVQSIYPVMEAAIGDDRYVTWADAYAAAKDGDTIELLKDATMTGKLTVAKNVTIDGNGHKIIANHTNFIVETSSDCEFRNVTLDTNNKAKGVKINTGNNVVFDNVTITKPVQNETLTVYGSLTLKSYFKAEANTTSIFDIRGGLTAEDGTVFELTGRLGTASPSKCDLEGVVDTEGNLYFDAYKSTYYVKDLNEETSLKGVTLLKDVTLEKNFTVSAKQTVNLNGHNLTVAEGKKINVNKGQLVAQNGTIDGAIVMNDRGDSIVGPENVATSVSVSADLAAKGYVAVYEEANGYWCVDLPIPNAIITDIKDELKDTDPDLTFALNFAFPTNLEEAYVNELFETYGNWYTDYRLTISGLSDESVTFNSNGEVDGYLAGAYGDYGWISVPFDDVTLENGDSIMIMETAAEMLGQSGLRFTLAEVASIVLDFDCGVYFTPEFLAANPNMEVKLELEVFAEQDKHGIDYVIPVATNEFKNDGVAIVTAENGQSEYYETLQAAVDAADGKTVTLLKNAEDAIVNGKIVFEQNGKEFVKLTLGNADATITAADDLKDKIVSGVDGLNVIYVNDVYSLAVDTNGNNVPDGEETITVTVIKALDGDTVTVEAVDAEAKAPVEKALGTPETKTYVFDSTKPGIKITATPVLTDGVSESYVASFTGVDMDYGEDYAASGVITAVNGAEITVEFKTCGFEYNEDGEMRFYVGMETPDYETLYKAVIKTPAYDAEKGTFTAKYLARPAATYQMQVPVLFSWTVPIINYEIKIGGNMVDIDLADAWLDVGESFKTLTPEELQKQYDTEIQKIKDKIAAIDISDITLSNAWDKVKQFAAISDELTTLITTISNEAKYLGYHQFGASGVVDENGNAQEKLQITYKNEALYLVDENVYVTLVDDRIETSISAGDLTFEYDEFDDAAIMNALTLTDVDGNVIEGKLIKHADLVGTEVGERTFTVYYEGSWDYKPTDATFTLTVIKAPSKTDVQNLNVVYNGNSVEAKPVVTNKHDVAINVDMVEFLLGLDVAEFDIDGDGVKGLNGKVQLIVPEGLQSVFDAIGWTEGANLSLSDLIDLLNNELVSGMLEQWGITSDFGAALESALNAISNVVEAGDLQITIGGTYPENIGAYLHGAVTVDGNYETSYDIGYIIIKPVAEQTYLKWNYDADNFMFTQKMLLNENALGATAYVDPEFSAVHENANALVQNVFFGIDAQGNVVATLDGADLSDKAMENGAYTQLAFVVELANVSYYAVPLARAFVVVPEMYKVTLVGEEPVSNREMMKTFDGDEKGFSVIVTDENGAVVYSDHYQNPVALKDNAQIAVRYTGMQTNGTFYNELTKPVHAGVYGVTALYVESTGDEVIDLDSLNWDNLDKEDLYAILDTMAVGLDAGLLVIEPSESTITMEDVVVKDFVFDGYEVAEAMNVTATSVSGKADKISDPDYTMITAAVASTGDFSENGWDAVTGSVNVDFPEWVDGVLPESVANGMTVGELKEKLLTLDLSEELAELGATEEIINSLSNLTGNIVEALEQMPDDLSLTFTDDLTVNAVGAYAVMAIVTDSDHYPSMDAGILVISPDVETVNLKWNHEDDNFIWTRDLLDVADLLASAYDEDGKLSEDATAKITYQFITLDKNGALKVYEDAETLPNGAYVQLAYIELVAGGEMLVSDLIARPVVVMASNCIVTVENVETVFDNDQHGVNVIVTDNEGRPIDTDKGEINIVYAGLQTNGQAYLETNKAPVHAGVYEALVTYTEYTENGDLRYYGANAGYVMIDLTQAEISVDGGRVVYDGQGHAADITVKSTVDNIKPDVTVITGTANYDVTAEEAGISAITGNINIDFPRWLDARLAEYEFAQGIDKEYLIEFISAHREALIPSDELAELGFAQHKINGIIDSMNGAIDELLVALDKLPANVNITFEDDVTFTEPGAYVYYALVTDSDHYPVAMTENGKYVPVADTGLLIIEKADVTVYVNDVEVTYGEEIPAFTADIVGLVDGDALDITYSWVQDMNAGTYTITATCGASNKYNVTIVDGTLTIAPAAVTITVADQTKVYGEADPEFTAKVEGMKYNDKLEIEFSRETGEDVGEYIIKASAEDSNYVIDVEFGTLTITPAPATITVANQTKTYGEADPEFTADVEGMKYDDKLEIEFSRETGEDVGEYIIKASAEDPNYEISVEFGTLTIEKREAEIKIADVRKIYGEKDPAFTYEILPNQLVNGDTKLNITLIRDPEDTSEDVGEHRLIVGEQDKNYEIVDAEGWLEITPASVVIQIKDASAVYGEEPELSFTIVEKYGKITDADRERIEKGMTMKVGTINGTSWTNWDGSVGEYAITHIGDYGFMNGQNIYYRIVPGKLTVTAKDATVKADDVSCYIGEEFVLTYTADGLVEDDADAVKLVIMTKNADDTVGAEVAKEDLAVGEYYIVPVVSDNYKAEVINGTLTVKEKVPVTIKPAQDYVATLGADPDSIDVAITAMSNGSDTDGEKTYAEILGVGEFTLTDAEGNTIAPADAVKQVGTYTITPKYTAVAGYAVTVETAQLTIGEYVCYNVDTNVYYYDLSDALADVDDEATTETICMLKDVSETYVTVASGTTLDLNGHTVTAKYVFAVNGAHVIDNLYTGVLKVARNNITLDESNMYAPVWNTVDGYVFTRQQITDRGNTVGLYPNTPAEGMTLLKFISFFKTGNSGYELLKDGDGDNDIRVIVRLTWTKDGHTYSMDVDYNDEMVGDVVKANGKGDKATYTLTISGYENFSGLKAQPMIISGTGVTSVGTEFTIK